MANVRVFGYSGIVQLEKRLQKQFSSDSAMMRQERPFRRKKTADGLNRAGDASLERIH